MPGLGHGAQFASRRNLSAVLRRREGSVTTAITHGRTPGYDAGTDGDFFVDGANGSDSNDGLAPASAFATVGRALAEAFSATGEALIRVMGDGARYRENLRPVWNGGNLTKLTIASYGTDIPWITGADKVNGFTQCTAADSALLGPNFANIYKAQIPVGQISHGNFWRLLTCENGTPLKLAMLRDSETFDPFFTDATSVMFSAEAHPTLTITTNPTWFDTISHGAVLGGMSDTQLEQSVAVMHAYPNVASYIPVASAANGVLQLQGNNYRPNPGTQGAYTLLNAVTNIEPGGWAYRDDGAGTLTLYVWPMDPANLANGIEIAARKEALYITRGAARELVLDGLGFEMTSSTDTDYASGTVFFNTGSGGTTMRECHVRNFDHGAGITFKFLDNAVLERTTIEQGRSFGVTTVNATNAGVYNFRFANLLAADLSQTGFRCFGMRDSVLSDIKAIRTSAGGHANAINFYQGCDNVAIVRFTGGYTAEERLHGGYATNQSSSRLFFLHCTFPMAADGRAYVDQSVNGSTHPADPSENYLVNCWIPHEPEFLSGGAGTAGIVVGENTPAMNWHVYNCLTPKVTSTGGTLTRKGNLLTDGGQGTIDPTESVVADIDTLHVDAASGDFRPVAGGLLSTAAGQDVEAVVAAWEAGFPSVDFRKDVQGRAWLPAAPGIGPFGQQW